MRLSAVIACAARAQSSNARSNSSDCQSPVMTENGTPARSSALAWSCAPWIPWLYVRSAMSHSGVTLRSGWMFASASGTGSSSIARTLRIAGP